jgi:hypothetical protein
MTVSDAVRSEMLAVFARVVMIAASTIGLPAAGYLMVKMLNKADAIVERVEDHTVQLKLINQGVTLAADVAKSDMSMIRSVVSDHETRIRVLERPAPGPFPVPH